MLLPARYCIERIKPFEIREREPANTISQRNIKNQIRLNDKTILFNIPDPVSVMFYNDCIAYPQIPDKGTIHTLIKEGYTVIVNDNERVDRNNFKGDSTFIIKKVY